MNIHRKDRARLKQTADESFLSGDAANQNPLTHHQPSADNSSRLESTDQDKDCSLKMSLTLCGEGDTSPPHKDGMEKLHQLSLFSEKPPEGNDQRARCSVGGHEEKTRHSTRDSSQKELDLELRLGQKPTRQASERRDFF